ncbi:MAG: aldo/keto reductase [Bacteroidetes bacterium]|nr:aldo/keto reductase [Bacteroidota bacterium]
MKTLTFQNNDTMPALGLGTWMAPRGEVGQAVREAIRIGYRHIDCAAIYGNEKEIGQALHEATTSGEVRREELWITSKLWNTKHQRASVRPALEKTLADLRLDYLDLYLIHWPVALKEGSPFPHQADHFIPLEALPLAETWEGMEACLDAGLTRHIGVSNFSIKKLKKLLETATHRPEMNQVEMHPLLTQNGLLDFCKSENIIVTAYCPLGRPGIAEGINPPQLLGDPVITGIAQQRNCTPAQVMLAWALERGTSPIPKSVNPRRLQENFDAKNVALTASDMAQINVLDRYFRFVDGTFWMPPGGPYTLGNLWDE